MIADSTVRSMCTIGQEISIWCEKNHIINQELADALAVSRETVKRIKNGTRELTSKEIRKLSVLMEKQADFFIPIYFMKGVLGEEAARCIVNDKEKK